MIPAKNKKYSNEHPRGKKSTKDSVKNSLSKSQEKKLLAYKGNGAVGEQFMELYNYYRKQFATPQGAFEFSEEQLRKVLGPGNQ